MMHAHAVKDPGVIAGFAVLAFSAVVAFEALRLFSVPELLLAALLATLGWQLRRRGLHILAEVGATTSKELRRRWVSFCLIALPVFVCGYVLGYFVLMDRHLPTYPHQDRHRRFESSFRWAGTEERPLKIRKSEPWPFPNVTIWNLIYRPLDKIYFHLHPRTEAEFELLSQRGWSW